jgi:hypothetical protein
VLIAVGASLALGTPHPELPGYIQLRAVAGFEREAARIAIPARRAERGLSQGAALNDGRQRCNAWQSSKQADRPGARDASSVGVYAVSPRDQ